MKTYLKHSIPKQLHSYGLGLEFVSPLQHEAGLWELQSQVLTATCPAKFRRTNGWLRSIGSDQRWISIAGSTRSFPEASDLCSPGSTSSELRQRVHANSF